MFLSFVHLFVALANSTTGSNSQGSITMTGSVSGGSKTAGGEGANASSSVSSFRTLTFSASAKTIATIAEPAREIQVVTTTVQAKCAPQTVSTTTAVPKPRKETLCVKCYDKFVTPDCKKCTTTCEDGTKIETDNAVTGKQCPNTNTKNVPCACKDESGRVLPENYYKDSGIANKVAPAEPAITGLGN